MQKNIVWTLVQGIVKIWGLATGLEKFERCSGLKINQTKSEAMWLGKWKNREDTPFNVKWPKDSVFA